jgi:hypothetical protein
VLSVTDCIAQICFFMYRVITLDPCLTCVSVCGSVNGANAACVSLNENRGSNNTLKEGERETEHNTKK